MSNNDAGSFVGLPTDQAEYNAWFQNHIRDKLFNTSGAGHTTYAAFANANTHLTGDLWRELYDTGRLPAGIPLFSPFAADTRGHTRVSVKLGVGRTLHRLAAAAFKPSHLGRGAVIENPTHHACHRLMPYPGSTRDFNPNNLFFETADFNRSTLFCKINFLRRVNLTEAEYAVAVCSPGLAREVGADAAAVERAQAVTIPQFEEAMAAVHQTCIKRHRGDTCCLFYHPGVGVAREYGRGPIPSVVASTERVPDLAGGVTGPTRRTLNVARANAITGLNLVLDGVGVPAEGAVAAATVGPPPPLPATHGGSAAPPPRGPEV